MADLPGLEAAPDGCKLGKQHSLPRPEPRHLVTVQTASGQAPGKPPFVLAAALCGGCQGLCFPGSREPPPSPVLSPGESSPALEAQLCLASETTNQSAW